MDLSPVIVDISSDEECGGGGGGGGDEYDWISEFFDKVDRESDDSDDVVLVGEVVLNPKPRSKPRFVAEKPQVKDWDDDEPAFVDLKDLDDDEPRFVAEKPQVKDWDDEEPRFVVDDDDDDCLVLDGDPDKPVVMENDIVGDSDDLLIVSEKGQIACRDYPHPRHLCAKFPFTSTPHDSHCHLCHCYVCDSLAPCVHWGNATSSVDHCHATDKHEFWKLQRRNLKQGDKVPLPVPKLPDTSVSVGPQQTIPIPIPPLPPPLQPNYLTKNQIYRPTTIRACSTSANSCNPNVINQSRRSQQSPAVTHRNNVRPHLVSHQFRRDRIHGVGNLGPQFTNSHAIFKRAGSAGVASTTYRSVYNSSRNHQATQYVRNPSPMAASNAINLTRQRDFSNGSRFGNSVPSSHHQVSSHPNRGNVNVNLVPPQPIVSSHSNIGNSFVHSVPYPQASSVPYPNMGSNFDDLAPSQPSHLYGFQQGNEAQNAMNPNFSDFTPSWVAPASDPRDPQSLTDNSHIHGAGPTYDPPFVPEFDPHIPFSPNASSPDFQFDDWNVYSPEDSGFYFDY